MYSCRDGCSGPLCVSEKQCDDIMIGKRHQKADLDVLSWLSMNGMAVEVGFDVKSLKLNVDDSLNTFTSFSSGLFFDILPGPSDTGIMHLFSSAQRVATEYGFERQLMSPFVSYGFRGSYGMGVASSMQLACTFCSGSRYMHWPSGELSEPRGMIAKDRDCTFFFTGGQGIKQLVSLPKIIIVTLHSLTLDSDDDVLSFIEGSWIESLRRGSSAPVEYHMPAYFRMRFTTKSLLFRTEERWDPVPDGLRFHLTYKTVVLTEEGRQCQLSCVDKGQYDPHCLKSKACAAMGSEVNLDGLDSLVDLERDFGLGDKTRSRWGARTSHIPPDRLRAEGSSAGKADDRLVLALSGYQGMDGEFPCMFAQNPQQLLLSLQRGGTLVSGLDGSWDGSCRSLPTCSFSPLEKCVSEEEYLGAANTCSVKYQVSGSIVREYRSNCNVGSNHSLPGILGTAHGIIETISSDPVEITAGATGVTVLRFRRIVLRWVKSNLADRVMGSRSYGYVTFGEGSDYDPRISSGMQIIFGRDNEYPLTEFDAALRRFSSRDGACRRSDLKFSQEALILPDGDTSYLMGYGQAGVLQDVRSYIACNQTLQDIQKLGKSSTICQRVIDLLLYRDATTTPTVPKDLCESNCWLQVQSLLAASSRKCSLRWRGQFYSGSLFKDRIYKKLHIVSTAHAYSKVLCEVNHKGEYCSKSIYDHSKIFQPCGLFEKTADSFFSSPFSVKDDRNGGNKGTCPRACMDALHVYQSVYGCCAASVTEAAIELKSILSEKSPFVLDLGVTNNPFTPLGRGLNFTYGYTQECTPSSAIRLSDECFMTSPAFCNRSDGWRETCCSFSCAAGGHKSRPGDCFCSCPHGRTGDRCQVPGAYAQVHLIFPGENDASFTYEKIQYVKRATADIAEVQVVNIELDTLLAIANSARRSSSINIVMRVLSPTAREASRLAQKLDAGLKDGRLMRSIAEICRMNGYEWPVEVSVGKYRPLAFDLFGREICDDVTVTCQLKVEDFGGKDGNGTKTVDGGSGLDVNILHVVMAALGTVLFIVLALCVHRLSRNDCAGLTGAAKALSDTSKYVAETVLPQKSDRPIPSDRNEQLSFGFASRGESAEIRRDNISVLAQKISVSKIRSTKSGSVLADDFEAGLSADIQYADSHSKPPTEKQTLDIMAKLFIIPEGGEASSQDPNTKQKGGGDGGGVPTKQRHLRYDYDPDHLEVGFRDVDAQRSQILNRFKYLQSLQAKPTVSAVGKPGLLTVKGPTDIDQRWTIPSVEKGDDNVWQNTLSKRIQRPASLPESLRSLDLYASNASSHTQAWHKQESSHRETVITCDCCGICLLFNLCTVLCSCTHDVFSYQAKTVLTSPTKELSRRPANAASIHDSQLSAVAPPSEDVLGAARTRSPLNITMAPGSINILDDLPVFSRQPSDPNSRFLRVVT